MKNCSCSGNLLSSAFENQTSKSLHLNHVNSTIDDALKITK